MFSQYQAKNLQAFDRYRQSCVRNYISRVRSWQIISRFHCTYIYFFPATLQSLHVSDSRRSLRCANCLLHFNRRSPFRAQRAPNCTFTFRSVALPSSYFKVFWRNLTRASMFLIYLSSTNSSHHLYVSTPFSNTLELTSRHEWLHCTTVSITTLP